MLIFASSDPDRQTFWRRIRKISLFCFSFSVASCDLYAQAQQESAGGNLKKLSIEELMEVEVTSVSRQPEKLTEVASAVQIITQEDIHRSGATSIPEVLRLSPNLQVAQLSSQHWIISARGFNAGFSNKLLVMIDGRTVYSPLFAGVFWDAQQVVLEDVERIEIISGPGATVWGANAVNGVINIITKRARDTQGLFVTAAAGSYLRGQYVARYGGQIGSRTYYRVFAQHNNRDNTFRSDGSDKDDRWYITQAGFRMGVEASESSSFSIQGNVYSGTEKTLPEESAIDGQNIMGRWNYAFSETSEMSLQLYFDRTWRRDIPSTISDELETYDLDFQHHFKWGSVQHVVWGLGYRLMEDKTQNATPIVGLVPQDRNMDLFSSFIQDEIRVADPLKFIIGAKFQHNEFSGFEIQPSARLAWQVNSRNTVWAAASRAIRAPSRIDVDYQLPTYDVPDGVPNVDGGPNFDSEKVLAYELGYRTQLSKKITLSLASYYNIYDDLYSVEALPNTVTYQIQNGVEGNSRGIEFSGTADILPDWRLRGGYTYFYKNLEPKPGHIANTAVLGNDAENIVLIQSTVTIVKYLQVDAVFRYIDQLPEPLVSDYFSYDVRLAWVTKHWEFSVVGQNLYEKRHIEYATEQTAEIPRSIYGRISWRY
ncbi:MAG TPA: TonB-dependent receptor [Ohtaekwangia sp.]